MVACSDPPLPAPVDPSSPSTAPYMEWRTAQGPVTHPVVRVVDEPGGPLDRIVADVDVTTFLNDRFHPIFRRPGAYPDEPIALAGTVQFFDPLGCPITPALRVWSPQELIDVANAVSLRRSTDSSTSPRLLLRCRVPPR